MGYWSTCLMPAREMGVRLAESQVRETQPPAWRPASLTFEASGEPAPKERFGTFREHPTKSCSREGRPSDLEMHSVDPRGTVLREREAL